MTYISREAAIEAIRSECVGCVGQEIGERFCCKCAIRQREVALYSVPAADVRPVAHGHYIGEYDGYADGNPVYDMWYCSECGCCFEDWDEKPTYNFCPNCGADMREVKVDG